MKRWRECDASLIDRAAAFTLDAACELRAIPLDGRGPRLSSAIAHLEGALLDLFYARNDPCRTEPKPRQLQLL